MCILRWRRTGCDNVAPAHCCSLWLQHGPAAILYVPRRHRAGMGARHGTTRSVGILSLITSPREPSESTPDVCTRARCTQWVSGLPCYLSTVLAKRPNTEGGRRTRRRNGREGREGSTQKKCNVYYVMLWWSLLADAVHTYLFLWGINWVHVCWGTCRHD